MGKNQGLSSNPMQNYWKKQKDQQKKKQQEKVNQVKKEREQKGMNQKKPERTKIGSDEEDTYGYGHFTKSKIAEIMEEKERRRKGQYKNTEDFMKEKKEKYGFTDTAVPSKKKNKFIDIPGYDADFMTRQKANKNLKHMHKRKEEHRLKEIYSQMKKDKAEGKQTELTEEQQKLYDKYNQKSTNKQIIMPGQAKNIQGNQQQPQQSQQYNRKFNQQGHIPPWMRGEKEANNEDPFYKTGQDEDYNPVEDYNSNQQQRQQYQYQKQLQQQEQLQQILSGENQLQQQQQQQFLQEEIYCKLEDLARIYNASYDNLQVKEQQQQNQNTIEQEQNEQQQQSTLQQQQQDDDIEKILQNQLGAQHNKQQQKEKKEQKTKEKKSQVQKSIMQQLMYDSDDDDDSDDNESDQEQEQTNTKKLEQEQDDRELNEDGLSKQQLEQIKYLQQQQQNEEQEQEQLKQNYESQQINKEIQKQQFYKEQQKQIEERQRQLSNQKGPRNIMQMANMQEEKLLLEQQARQAQLSKDPKNAKSVIVGQSTVKKSQIDLNQNAARFLPPQLLKKQKLGTNQEKKIPQQPQPQSQPQKYQEQQQGVNIIQSASINSSNRGSIPVPQYIQEEEMKLYKSQEQIQKDRKQEQDNLLAQEMFKKYLDEIKSIDKQQN